MKMSDKIKNIDIENRTYHFFNDMVNIENFDRNNIKLDQKTYKNISIYYIGYVTIKDLKYLKVYSVNLCTWFSINWMDALKKLMDISI